MRKPAILFILLSSFGLLASEPNANCAFASKQETQDSKESGKQTPIETKPVKHLGEGGIMELRLFAGTFIIRNSIPCDGRELPIKEYEKLYRIVGDQFGRRTDDLFSIPNLASTEFLNFKDQEPPESNSSFAPPMKRKPVQFLLDCANVTQKNPVPAVCVGQIIMVGESTKINQHWLECDGIKYSKSDHPELAKALGNRFGGNGEQFCVPDLRSARVESPRTQTGFEGKLAKAVADEDFELAAKIKIDRDRVRKQFAQNIPKLRFVICSSLPKEKDAKSKVPYHPYVGEIILLAGPLPESGWIKCDGTNVKIEHAGTGRLFSLLGTLYGGDGRTTFRVPDTTPKSEELCELAKVKDGFAFAICTKGNYPLRAK